MRSNPSALLRRHLFQPLYGSLVQSPKLGYWRSLEQTQFWSEDRLRATQWQRLQALVRFVWDRNEFYRRRFEAVGLCPEAIRNVDDLRQLPMLTKAEIRDGTKELISRGYAVDRLQQARTGGSTGTALELFFTEECSEVRNACARRHDRWTGWEPGEPVAACWGNPQLPHSFKQRLKQQLLQPTIYLDTMHVDRASVETFIGQWRKVKPTLLFGHAHSIYLLACWLRDLNIDELRPRGILSSSMMLVPS